MTIGNGLHTPGFWREQGGKCLHCHNLAIPPNRIFRDTGFAIIGIVDFPIIYSELAPDFDVVGILFQMLGEDSVGIAADGSATVAEDS